MLGSMHNDRRHIRYILSFMNIPNIMSKINTFKIRVDVYKIYNIYMKLKYFILFCYLKLINKLIIIIIIILIIKY